MNIIRLCLHCINKLCNFTRSFSMFTPPSCVIFSILMIEFHFVIRQTRSRSSSHDKTENVRASSVPDRRVTRHSLESVPSRGRFSELLNYSYFQTPRPSCSKLTTSLVNDSLKFQMAILQIHCYFLLKKCENPLQCKGFSHFINKK